MVEVVGEIAVEVGVGVAVVVVVRVPTQRGQQNTVVSLQVPLNTVSPVYRAFHTNWKLTSYGYSQYCEQQCGFCPPG